MYSRAVGDGDATDWRSPPQTSDTIYEWLGGIRQCRVRTGVLACRGSSGEAREEPDAKDGPQVDNMVISPAIHPLGYVVREPVGDTCHGYPRLRTFQPRA